MWYFYTFGLILNCISFAIVYTYTSQVTYTNPTNSEEFCCGFQWISVQQAAERPCCVRGMFVLCLRISILSAAYPQSDWLARLPFVVTKKTIVSQVANLSCREKEFQQFPRRLSLEFAILDLQIPLSDSTDFSLGVHGLFVKCLRMLPGLLRFATC